MKRTLNILWVILMITIACCKKDNNSPEETNNTINDKTTPAIFNPSVVYGTMTDQDGNVYKTVTIGNQTWMAENLRTTKYNDGTPIPKVTSESGWSVLDKGAYCYNSNNSNPLTITTYGCLYNWHAVNTGLLEPKGWRVPYYSDWLTLQTNLGGWYYAGGKLKETGTSHWQSPNSEATNITGFTALPGGFRSYDGSFIGFGVTGRWWTSTRYDLHYGNTAYFVDLIYDGGHILMNDLVMNFGYSVRCIKN